MIVLHETGLHDRVECIRSVVASAGAPNEAVMRDNPLGQIPTLVLDDGTALFDSRVICEYLDGQHDGARMFPVEAEERFRQLRWMALCDGLVEILFAFRGERLRKGGLNDVLLSALETKIRACFAALENDADLLVASPFAIGHAAVICAIAQLDFRFPKNGWQTEFPALAKWRETVESRPSVVATAIRDDSAPTPSLAPQDVLSPFVFAEPLQTDRVYI